MANEQLVKKLTITAYTDITCKTKIKEPFDIILQVNPTEIAVKYSISYGQNDGSSSSVSMNKNESAAGSAFKPRTFDGYECPGLHVDTMIDATGVLTDPYKDTYWSLDDGSVQPTVEYYIERMKKVLYSWQSEQHGPPFLLVQWGSVLPSHSNNSSNPEGMYKCQLRDMEFKYTLFSAEGYPIRAEISLDFDGVEDPVKAGEGYSPDLSHIIEVKFGDNLPKLCKDFYSSPVPITIGILQIARINNLPSIYAIEPGMKLVFPPLKKASR